MYVSCGTRNLIIISLTPMIRSLGLASTQYEIRERVSYQPTCRQVHQKIWTCYPGRLRARFGVYVRHPYKRDWTMRQRAALFECASYLMELTLASDSIVFAATRQSSLIDAELLLMPPAKTW